MVRADRGSEISKEGKGRRRGLHSFPDRELSKQQVVQIEFHSDYAIDGTAVSGPNARAVNCPPEELTGREDLHRIGRSTCVLSRHLSSNPRTWHGGSAGAGTAR